MQTCPTCNYSWAVHDESDAQRCYGQWLLRQRARPEPRTADRKPRRVPLRAPTPSKRQSVEGSPAWREPYLEPRAAA